MVVTERVYEGVMTVVGMNVLQKQPRSGVRSGLLLWVCREAEAYL